VIIVFSNVHSVFADSASAPDFTVTDIDGNTFSLKDFQGKIVIMDLFEIQCPACMEEIAQLKTVRNQFGEDLAIISISISPTLDTVEELKTLRSNYNITWILARDTTGVSKVYPVLAYPTLYIIDKNSYLRYEHGGTVESSVLAEEVTALIPEYPFLFIPLLMGLATIAVITASVNTKNRCLHKIPSY
jgi:peroxiredoxin